MISHIPRFKGSSKRCVLFVMPRFTRSRATDENMGLLSQHAKTIMMTLKDVVHFNEMKDFYIAAEPSDTANADAHDQMISKLSSDEHFDDPHVVDSGLEMVKMLRQSSQRKFVTEALESLIIENMRIIYHNLLDSKKKDGVAFPMADSIDWLKRILAICAVVMDGPCRINAVAKLSQDVNAALLVWRSEDLQRYLKEVLGVGFVLAEQLVHLVEALKTAAAASWGQDLQCEFSDAMPLVWRFGCDAILQPFSEESQAKAQCFIDNTRAMLDVKGLPWAKVGAANKDMMVAVVEAVLTFKQVWAACCDMGIPALDVAGLDDLLDKRNGATKVVKKAVETTSGPAGVMSTNIQSHLDDTVLPDVNRAIAGASLCLAPSQIEPIQKASDTLAACVLGNVSGDPPEAWDKEFNETVDRTDKDAEALLKEVVAYSENTIQKCDVGTLIAFLPTLEKAAEYIVHFSLC